MGIAIGRNQGLLIADKYQDKWLSTLDNDIELHPGWLTECLNVVKTNHKFAIGINMEGQEYPLQVMNGKSIQWKKEGNLGTACTVFHKKLHEAIGFFTTEYGTLYGTEDANFFFRARIAGWQMGYLPTNGVHFGVNELDTGEYRVYKDECHKANLAQFQRDCYAYMNKTKSIYHPYSERL
jgi:GT2 family glycosyltransferase